jgi:hypothetical protein
VSSVENTEEKDGEEYISALGVCCSERLDKTAFEELQNS